MEWLEQQRGYQMSLILEEVIDHIRNRSYMSGVQRTQSRVKATGEVFTPTELVREVLGNINIEKFKISTPSRVIACLDFKMSLFTHFFS